MTPWNRALGALVLAMPKDHCIKIKTPGRSGPVPVDYRASASKVLDYLPAETTVQDGFIFPGASKLAALLASAVTWPTMSAVSKRLMGTKQVNKEVIGAARALLEKR
jgi:hypothetical protein